MIARHVIPRTLLVEPDFRWRGGEVSRIAGLSDAAFAACFALLMWIWWVHHKFDRDSAWRRRSPSR
jgi:hypothetical protein